MKFHAHLPSELHASVTLHPSLPWGTSTPHEMDQRLGTGFFLDMVGKRRMPMLLRE